MSGQRKYVAKNKDTSVTGHGGLEIIMLSGGKVQKFKFYIFLILCRTLKCSAHLSLDWNG